MRLLLLAALATAAFAQKIDYVTQIKNKPFTTTGETPVYNNGLLFQSTNPTLTTPDYSFFESVKGMHLETVISDGGPLGVGFASQMDIQADASTLGSAQALRGNLRVANGAEVYGILGYVDVQTLTPQTAAIAGIIRGMLADPGTSDPVSAVAAVSEGDHPAVNGVAVYSSDASNHFYYGVRVFSSRDAAYVGTVDESGIGLKLTNSVPASGAPDSQTAIEVNRVFGDVGDTLDLTFGSGTPGSHAAKVKAAATSTGVHGLIYSAYIGSTEHEIMRMSAERKVSIGTSTLSSTLYVYDSAASGDTDVIVRAGAAEDWFIQAWQTTAAATGLAVSSGAQLMFGGTAEGTCDSTTRGTVVMVHSGSGSADTLRVCSKDAANAYAWRSLL